MRSLKRPNNKLMYPIVAISIILGLVLYVFVIEPTTLLWVHLISIFISLVIVEYTGNIHFPIDPRNKCMENVDIVSATILFVVVFGLIATIFISITSLLITREK